MSGVVEHAVPIGAILGGTYRLNRLIGAGGMGSVYEAGHLRVPRRFAVKLLNPEVVGNRELFERFRREAEIAGELGHENIVQVFDFNYTDNGIPYMVLELLEGQDLATRLHQRGRLPLGVAARVMEQVAGALAVAHAAGVVHRDLKPQNLFLCRRGDRDDFVKILDFGISKVLHSQTMATRTGVVLGTPNYMSPEQATGTVQEVDHRTDIFALGAIIYECVTGRTAFQAPTPIGTLYQVCHGEPTPLRQLAPDLPAALEKVVARALAKHREQRYQTVGELLASFLAACSKGTARDAKPPPRAPSAPPHLLPTVATPMPGALPAAPRRRGGVWIAGGLLAAVAATGIILATRPAREPSHVGAEPEPLAVSAAAPPAPVRAAAPAPAAQLPAAAPAPPPAAEVSPPVQPARPVPPPPPAEVTVALDIQPAGARVEVDGVVTSDSPLRLPRSDEQVHRVVISAPGHRTVTREVRAGEPSTLTVQLERLPAPAPPRRPKTRVVGPVEDHL